jgi:propionate CoA-transferase
MSIVDEAGLLLRLVSWAVATARHDTRIALRVPRNAKFMSARDAVERVPDTAVVAVSGLGGHQRASILHWALRERFEETGRPRRLTLVNVGGHGGRGVLPGTRSSPGPGSSHDSCQHFETLPRFLELAAAGRCELQCLPLGVIAQLYEALGRGEESIVSEVGAGSFLDPRVGRGSPVQGGRREQWVTVEAERLRYRMPRIDVAIFNLPAADRFGNLYAGGAAMVGDSREIAQAAKRNGGVVIANVGRLVDERRDHVFLPADLVDAIVCRSDTEQTLGFFHRDPWKLVLPHGEGEIGDGLDHARLIRRLGAISGGFPRRTPVEGALARLAARFILNWRVVRTLPSERASRGRRAQSTERTPATSPFCWRAASWAACRRRDRTSAPPSTRARSCRRRSSSRAAGATWTRPASARSRSMETAT